MMTPERARELTGHTPGPLVVSFESVDPEWAIVSTYGGRIVANVHCDCIPGGFRNDANARIIAASPDLLTAYLAHEDRVQGLVGEVERLREALRLFVAYDEAMDDDGVEMMLAYATAIEAARAALKEPKP